MRHSPADVRYDWIRSGSATGLDMSRTGPVQDDLGPDDSGVPPEARLGCAGLSGLWAARRRVGAGPRGGGTVEHRRASCSDECCRCPKAPGSGRRLAARRVHRARGRSVTVTGLAAAPKAGLDKAPELAAKSRR